MWILGVTLVNMEQHPDTSKSLEHKLNLILAELEEIKALKNEPLCPWPATIRMPKTGERCPFTGYSRAKLYDLLKKRKIRAKSDKAHSEAETGICLILGSSLWKYIHSLPDYQPEE